MVAHSLIRRVVVLSAVTAISGGVALAKPPSDDFFEAYYLEHEKGDYAAAAELYQRVAKSADGDLRRSARERLNACREELATSDFARLMPPEVLAYIEVNEPGSQVHRLLDMLGLLAEPGGDPASGPRVAVSPRLIKAVLGIRGAAVAITGFDPGSEMPHGVGVLHPGSVEAIRGLIETGLPAASLPQEPIDGYPVYNIEDEVLACLTSRLVIVSPQREHIEGVVRRLRGKEKKSLADNEELQDIRGEGDALVSCFVNARAIVPMAMAMAGDDPEAHMVSTLLDLKSLRSVAAKVGVGEKSVFVDASVRLDSGHHNLAYNLIRTPPLSRATFSAVPSGAAGFFAAALSENDGGVTKASEVRSITGLDIGREIFANIVDVVAYVMPPDHDGRSDGGGQLPDAALVIRVKDPSRSEALWSQILGIASLCAGAPTMDGDTEKLGGVTVRTYHFPEVDIRLAINDDRLFITTTRGAMKQAVRAVRGGDSILDDDAFAHSLARLTRSTSKAVWVHPGRMLQVSKPFMSDREYREAAQYSAMMSDLVAMAMTDESEEEFHLAVTVSGLPKVGPMLSQMLEHEHRTSQRHRQFRSATRNHDWDGAASMLERMIAEDPGNPNHYRELFELYALRKKDRHAAMRYVDKLTSLGERQPMALNNLAWDMLTDNDYEQQYDDAAMTLAEIACKVTNFGNWAYVDTLALAKFRAGQVADAAELQRKAIELHGGDDAELKKTLERYERALR